MLVVEELVLWLESLEIGKKYGTVTCRRASQDLPIEMTMETDFLAMATFACSGLSVERTAQAGATNVGPKLGSNVIFNVPPPSDVDLTHEAAF